MVRILPGKWELFLKLFTILCFSSIFLYRTKILMVNIFHLYAHGKTSFTRGSLLFSLFQNVIKIFEEILGDAFLFRGDLLEVKQFCLFCTNCKWEKTQLVVVYKKFDIIREASRVSFVYIRDQSINLGFDIGTRDHDDINMMISTHIKVAWRNTSSHTVHIFRVSTT